MPEYKEIYSKHADQYDLLVSCEDYQGNIPQALERIRSQTSLPVAVGFGIKTKQQVREISSIADAAVVGSALVNVVAEGKEQSLDNDHIVKNLHSLVTELASGVR